MISITIFDTMDPSASRSAYRPQELVPVTSGLVEVNGSCFVVSHDIVALDTFDRRPIGRCGATERVVFHVVVPAGMRYFLELPSGSLIQAYEGSCPSLAKAGERADSGGDLAEIACAHSLTAWIRRGFLRTVALLLDEATVGDGNLLAPDGRMRYLRTTSYVAMPYGLGTIDPGDGTLVSGAAKKRAVSVGAHVPTSTSGWSFEFFTTATDLLVPGEGLLLSWSAVGAELGAPLLAAGSTSNLSAYETDRVPLYVVLLLPTLADPDGSTGVTYDVIGIGDIMAAVPFRSGLFSKAFVSNLLIDRYPLSATLNPRIGWWAPQPEVGCRINTPTILFSGSFLLAHRVPAGLARRLAHQADGEQAGLSSSGLVGSSLTKVPTSR